MASTVRQDPVSGASGGSGTTEAATINGIATGSVIHAWGTHDAGGGSPTITCSDGVQTFTNIPELDVTDTTNVQRNFAFYKENSTSGNKTVTCTFSFGVVARGICLIEVDGVLTSGALDMRAAQVQQTPGTGANGVTSGATAALNAAPNIVLALSMCNGGSGVPAAGTGYSSPNGTYSIWNFGAGLTARVENKNTSALTAVSGTFTAAGNTAHTTQVVVYDDIGSAGAAANPPSGKPKLSAWLDPPPAPQRRPVVSAFLATPPAVNAPLPRTQQMPSQWWQIPDISPAMRVGVGIAAILASTTAAAMPPPPPRQTPAAWWAAVVPPPAQPEPGVAAITATPPVTSVVPPARVRVPFMPEPWVAPMPPPDVAAILAPTPPKDSLFTGPVRQRMAVSLWPAEASPQQRRPMVAAIMPPAASSVLAVYPSGRYLTNAGVPWPMFTRTVWGLPGLSAANYQALIDDTVAKGYTCIEFAAILHDPRSTWVPTAGNGTLPFSLTLAGAAWTGGLWPSVTSSNLADFTTPVTAYWNYIRDIVDYAATKGVVCFLFPSYHGIGGADGWMNEMMENGLTNMASHGAFVANLLKTRSNIIWGLGGDYGTAPNTYSPTQLAAEQGFVQGLLSVGGQASTQYGAEWNTESIGADQVDHVTGTTGPTFGDTLTIQTYYSFTGDVIVQGRRAYSASPVKPAVMQECPFEDEEPTTGTGDNTASTAPVRRYHWMSLLSGIAGYNMGNAYIWRTNLSGTPPASDDYRNHLNSLTAQDDSILHGVYRSYNWWLLVPSGLAGMNTLTAAGTGNQSLTAACSSDGTIMFVYSGPDGNGGQFTADLRRMNNNIRARWLNPSTGVFSTNGSAAGTFTLANTASAQSFTPPGANGSGFNDWVLVLDTAPTTPDAIVIGRNRASLAALAWWSDPPIAQQQRPDVAAILAPVVIAQVPPPPRQTAQALWIDPPIPVQQVRPDIAALIPAAATAQPPPARAPIPNWDPTPTAPQPRPSSALLPQSDLPPPMGARPLAQALWVDAAPTAQTRAGIAAVVQDFPPPPPARAPASWLDPAVAPQPRPGIAAILAAQVTLVPSPRAPAPNWDPIIIPAQPRPSSALLPQSDPPPPLGARPVALWVDQAPPAQARTGIASLLPAPVASPPPPRAQVPAAIDPWSPPAPPAKIAAFFSGPQPSPLPPPARVQISPWPEAPPVRQPPPGLAPILVPPPPADNPPPLRRQQPAVQADVQLLQLGVKVAAVIPAAAVQPPPPRAPAPLWLDAPPAPQIRPGVAALPPAPDAPPPQSRQLVPQGWDVPAPIQPRQSLAALLPKSDPPPVLVRGPVASWDQAVLAAPARAGVAALIQPAAPSLPPPSSPRYLMATSWPAPPSVPQRPPPIAAIVAPQPPAPDAPPPPPYRAPSWGAWAASAWPTVQLKVTVTGSHPAVPHVPVGGGSLRAVRRSGGPTRSGRS